MQKRYIVVKTKDVDDHLEVKNTSGVYNQYPLTRGMMTVDIIDADDSVYEEICNHAHVISVTEDEVMSIPDPIQSLLSGDSDFENIGLNLHNIRNVWKQGSRGKGIRVGVLDTGIDEKHARTSFGQRIVAKRNFTTSSSEWDLHGHGTHVAGTIAGDDSIGVAPEAELVIAKVLGDNGSGFTSSILQGIQWCVDQGCHVLNLSLGGTACRDDNPVLIGLHEARKLYVVPIVAAGNNGCHIGSEADSTSPACSEDAITVAAIDHRNNPASFSSCGQSVDIAAFGKDVLSYWLDGGYNIISGTSMAAPHVAGVAALLLSKTHKGILRRNVWSSLLVGADESPHGMIHVGVGILNAQASNRRARSINNG